GPYTAVRLVMLSTLDQGRKSKRAEIGIRQGLVQSRALARTPRAATRAAVFAADSLLTPRRTSSAYRWRPVFHCRQKAHRTRLLIHESKSRNTEGVSQKPK